LRVQASKFRIDILRVVVPPRYLFSARPDLYFCHLRETERERAGEGVRWRERERERQRDSETERKGGGGREGEKERGRERERVGGGWQTRHPSASRASGRASLIQGLGLRIKGKGLGSRV